MVFMTGGSFTPLSKEFLDSVPNRVVEKPFDLRELKKLLLQLGTSGPRESRLSASSGV